MDFRKRKSQKRSTKVPPEDLLAIEFWRAYWKKWLRDLERYERHLKVMHPADAGLDILSLVRKQYGWAKNHANKTLGIDFDEMIRTRNKDIPVPEDEPDPDLFLAFADWLLRASLTTSGCWP